MKILKEHRTDIVGILFVLFYIATLPYATMIFSQWGERSLRFCYILGGITSVLFGCIALGNVLHDLYEEKFYSFFKSHFLMILWLISGIGGFLAGRNLKVLLLLIMLIALKNCDFTKISRYMYAVHILFMIFMIVSVLHGNIVEMQAARDGVVRYSLGYMYPLELHGEFFSIVLLLLYIKKEHFDFNDLLIINLSNLFLFYLTRARTDALLILFITVFIWILNRTNTNKRVYLNRGLVILLVLLIIWGPVLFCYFGDESSMFYRTLDQILGSRLLYMKKGFESFGVTVFGKDITWVGWGINGAAVSEEAYNFIDNSYLHDMFNYGIVYLAVLTVSWIRTIFVLKQKNDIYGIAAVVVFLLGSMVEYHTLNAYTGAQMFFLCYALNASFQPQKC